MSDDCDEQTTPNVLHGGGRSAPGWRLAFIMAVVGFVAVTATLYQPGLTVDEPINASHGVRMVATFLESPAMFVEAERRVHGVGGKPDHPPLTRWCIGWSHYLLAGANGQTELSPKAGRLASAVAFALLLAAVTRVGERLGGLNAGVGAGLSLLLMPRVFAHAHLAAPEMISATLFCFGVFSVEWALRPEAGRLRAAWRLTAGGVILGLALLTKLTCVLLPVCALIWCCLSRRFVTIPLLVYWGLIGLLVFVAGWPWLWPIADDGSFSLNAVIDHLTQFLSIGVDRATVYTWYWGTQWPTQNSAAPWHYAWFYFLATVPLGLQILGATLGAAIVFTADRERKDALTLIGVAILVPLLLFTLPVARYDGERLFLMVFPLWAILIGMGVARLHWVLCNWSTLLGHSAVTLLIVGQAVGVVIYHPVQLCYYNALAGGLRGANRLGMEADYWGVSLTDRLLNELATRARTGDTAILIPTLYAGHAVYLANPELARKEIVILPADQRNDDCRWAVVFNRASYLQEEWIQTLLATKPEFEVSRDGVWLSRIYSLKGDRNTK